MKEGEMKNFELNGRMIYQILSVISVAKNKFLSVTVLAYHKISTFENDFIFCV
jgi:hypothetical protein